MSDLQSLVVYARSFLGTHYKIGGRNRLEGIDCSQYVIELLISRGIFPHGYDNTAQGLFTHFVNQNGSRICKPQIGALAFYGKDADSIVHVAFCIDDQTMIEAGGGDRSTDTLEEAVDRSAMVRERPVRYRKDYYCTVLPPYDQVQS